MFLKDDSHNKENNRVRKRSGFQGESPQEPSEDTLQGREWTSKEAVKTEVRAQVRDIFWKQRC